MSMQDPVADMLTRIRNAQQAKHGEVKLSASKLKQEIARVLKEEGYIEDYAISDTTSCQKELAIRLKYYQGQPVIKRIQRVSRSGCRVYKAAKELQPIAGFGISILTTPMGVMTHVAAKKANVGGEVICEVA